MAGDFDKYYEERYKNYTWYNKILSKTIWPIQFYISDRIEELKYKLYVKLYCWFDCLPPDERDL